MSISRFCGFRRIYRILLTGTAGLVLTTAVQADDLLEQTKRRQEVAAQKFEADVRDAVREAQRQASSDRTKAISCLKQALSTLEADTTLSSERRNALIRMLQDRIRVTESGSPAPGDEILMEKKSRAEARRRIADISGNAGQVEEARRRFAQVRDLQQDGQASAASKKASDFARDRPADTAALANALTAAAAAAAVESQKLQRDGAARRLAALRDVDSAARPPRGDIEFPKDWQERTRDRGTAVKLTAREKALLQALNTPVTVSFKGSRFEDVLEYLSTITGQSILVDKTALEEAQITYDTPITVHAKGVTVRTLLRKVLNDLGLAYIIKDETIQAVTLQRARESLVVRSYYIGDLLAGLNSLPGFGFGPGPDPQLALQTVNQLIDMIQSSVEPSSWKINGGPGTITFSPASLSLVVSQSAEVHALLANGGLR